MDPKIIIHGGLATYDDPTVQTKLEALGPILDQAYDQLLKTNAIDAVVLAVKLMEDQEPFNAGIGADLQADGQARLSASLIDGKEDKFSGVINIEEIRNPILVAQRLQDEKNKVLASDEAIFYALTHGFKQESVKTPLSIERWMKKKFGTKDTVGACALDRNGNIASATSTGGEGNETPGRVSDSCMPAGNFGNDTCVVSATGTGQQLINQCLAAKIVIRCLDCGSLNDAFEKSFTECKARQSEAGAIGLDNKGNIAWRACHGILIYGFKDSAHRQVKMERD